jgi:hypothetical protein
MKRIFEATETKDILVEGGKILTLDPGDKFYIKEEETMPKPEDKKDMPKEEEKKEPVKEETFTNNPTPAEKSEAELATITGEKVNPSDEDKLRTKESTININGKIYKQINEAEKDANGKYPFEKGYEKPADKKDEEKKEPVKEETFQLKEKSFEIGKKVKTNMGVKRTGVIVDKFSWNKVNDGSYNRDDMNNPDYVPVKWDDGTMGYHAKKYLDNLDESFEIVTINGKKYKKMIEDAKDGDPTPEEKKAMEDEKDDEKEPFEVKESVELVGTGIVLEKGDKFIVL